MSDRGRAVDLVWLGTGPPPRWDQRSVLGAVGTDGGAGAGRRGAGEVDVGRGGAPLGAPPASLRTTSCRRCWRGSAEVWHSGLLLGISGNPTTIDAVRPSWMFNRDTDPHRVDVVATLLGLVSRSNRGQPLARLHRPALRHAPGSRASSSVTAGCRRRAQSSHTGARGSVLLPARTRSASRGG